MIVVNPRNHGVKNAIFRVPFGIFSTLVSVTFFWYCLVEIQPTEIKGPDCNIYHPCLTSTTSKSQLKERQINFIKGFFADPKPHIIFCRKKAKIQGGRRQFKIFRAETHSRTVCKPPTDMKTSGLSLENVSCLWEDEATAHMYSLVNVVLCCNPSFLLLRVTDQQRLPARLHFCPKCHGGLDTWYYTIIFLCLK